MFVIITVLALWALAGYCNGIMDYVKLLQLDKESWKNKYQVDSFGNPIPYKGKTWYYFDLYNPKFEEKFPFSTTILVFTTDNWHFAKWGMLTALQASIMLVVGFYEQLEWYYVLLGIIFLKVIFGVFFSFKYDNEKKV